MLTQMLPWIITAALVGVILGLILGIYVASVIARGHYNHFLKASPRTSPLPRQRPLDWNEEDRYMRMRHL